ncbi:hypothetical protein DICPUDRAFT_50853 [Dictyostelium purpureum]|uniref:Rab-GAP TBC domain-containing protein n=1 Tax=Dictyostelium purpureum TaxID=5786 RepID=F1A0N7_DICPU|nr:uncharacterized protein DICPUDRAFT_50853 [Dictyostelium purpureum]EGC30241.1 hypothetical protein DICPUDRAFT_50853 [Dictyostelium purpureum]|eukprot:XP_003293233.1 hypothetical protein DICPUDRAFT_50853 [Dictyostelium purpureum]
MSFVAALIIPYLSEEEAFHILVRFFNGVMRDFYGVGMKELQLRVFQLKKFVEDLFPKLHKHLNDIELDTSIFTSPWFLTVFAYHFSDEVATRILDVIFFQGLEAFFSIALAIFQIIQDDLLECTENSQAMSYFRNETKTKIDVDTLMSTANRISISPSQLANFKQQFENEFKPTVISQFNPDETPEKKLKDPRWVVKKYKLKERISNLEDDLAHIKQELHYNKDKNEEEKRQTINHLKDLADRESSSQEKYHQQELRLLQLEKENQNQKQQIAQYSTLNQHFTQQISLLNSELRDLRWQNNPKNSIQFS